jgi:predicted GIY-YIG superfamily endonuclease
MKIEKALKIYKEKYDSPTRLVAPRVYMLRSTVNGEYALTDQGCYFPSREEWEVLKTLTDNFYKNVSDEEINKHNDEMYQSQGLPPSNEPRAKKERKKEAGFVYFIQADNGLVKIGRTKDIQQRLDHFTAKLPYKLELVHSIKSNDSVELEKVFHEKYHDKRKRGEWFDLNTSDLKEVKKWV